MTGFRPLALALGVLATSAALAACGGGDDDGAAGAGGTSESTGTLTIYSGRDEELVAPLIEQYEEQSGVEMEVRYGDTAELAATILEEGDNSPADVFFSQDAGALGALQKEGRLAALPQDALEAVQPEFRSADGQWVGVSGRTRIVAYDARDVEEGDLPASVLDLTGDEWEGRVAWAPTNASFQAFVTAFRTLEGDDAAREWLERMVENDVQVYEGNSEIRDAIAAGEIDVGLINHYYVAEARAEEGEDYPVGIHMPAGDVGSLINVAGAAVLSSTENQEEAAEFVRFLLDAEAQAFFSEETKEYPLAAGVEADPALVALGEIDQPEIDLSDLDDLEGTLELIEEAGAL